MDDDEQPADGDLVPVDVGEHIVISDGAGLAVIGDSAAVEEFLQRKGLWDASTTLDLGWLRHLMTFGSEAAQAVADAAANSGRWVKLTKESAEAVKEHGLMDTKTPGVRWLMAGKPGDISKWLSTESGPIASAANPEVLVNASALLSNAAGVMAQMERKQELRAITELLSLIDTKLDDVRRAGNPLKP